MDTIFALSTAPGKAGISVVRISGARSFDAIERLCGDIPPPRRAAVRVLRDSADIRLDEALVLTFAEGQSFTGEQSAELHLHGSVAVQSAVLRELGGMEDLRPAEPGEFTKRALENGRLDLAQVEGLADLIDAETEAQRRQALRVLSGDLGRKAEAWRVALIRSAALLEATIDFADEDVPVDVTPEVRDLIGPVLRDLTVEIDGVGVAERIRTGFEVAIVGAPNVGKSTLLNALAGRDAAITSQVAGTTRDVIEVRMDLAGLPVTVLDTAGLRETADEVEAIGIERAKMRAEQADLRVFLVEKGAQPELPPQPQDIVVGAKADLRNDPDGAVSGKTGAGLSSLVDAICNVLVERTARSGVATRERHRVAMKAALSALDAALERMDQGEIATDLAAEELRSAVRALDSLIGRVDIENVLDEIFASFCLGK